MYKFGNQSYELPTNTDLEKVLQKNLDNINPVEMKEKVVDGKKMLFPFWTPVKDASGISFTDYKKYLSGKEKRLDIMAKKDQVGIVQPKDETKTYEETNIIDKINSVIDRQKNAKVFDNSGVVKVIKNEMDATKTSKQVIDNKVGEPKEVKVEKSAKSKTGVGAVTPQADMGKQTSVDVAAQSSSQKATPTTKTQITDNKVGEPKEAKVEKSAKSKTGVGAVKPQAEMGKQTKVDVTAGSKKATGEKVGAVKPKSEKMTAGTKKQVTDNKVDKPVEPTVELAGSKPATGVGAVKPKADMGKQNVGDLNFNKFKTDHIKGPVLEATEEKKDVVKEGEKIFGVPIEKTFKKISKGFKEQKAAEKLTENNENVKKFIGFVESFKGQGQDDLIESVKTGFQSCFEAPEDVPVYDKLLEKVKSGQAILTAGEIHPDIPTIHNFCPKEYFNTVQHMGFGMFTGKTPHGGFDFDGGGAMRRETNFSWTPLSASPEVLQDLKYDLGKVAAALETLKATSEKQ